MKSMLLSNTGRQSLRRETDKIHATGLLHFAGYPAACVLKRIKSAPGDTESKSCELKFRAFTLMILI